MTPVPFISPRWAFKPTPNASIRASLYEAPDDQRKISDVPFSSPAQHDGASDYGEFNLGYLSFAYGHGACPPSGWMPSSFAFSASMLSAAQPPIGLSL